MKTRKLLLLFLVCLAVLCGRSASAASKHALLVGVSKYRHDRMNDTELQFPEADAKAVADELKKSGFTVVTLLGKQASQAAVKKELAALSKKGQSGGVCLVGLFGHGVQYGNDAYYAPHDTGVRNVIPKGEKQPLRDKFGNVMLEPDPESMTSMRSILDALSKCGASHRVLLADCCREDPSAARGRAFGSKLTVAQLPPGTAAVFACSAQEQAFEHKDWGHGAFTYALLKKLRSIPLGATANELSAALYRDVSKKPAANPIKQSIRL